MNLKPLTLANTRSRLSGVLMDSPESATNRPMRARLLAEGGTIRGIGRRRRSPERSTWLMLGVMLGVLACQVIDLWRAVEHAR